MLTVKMTETCTGEPPTEIALTLDDLKQGQDRTNEDPDIITEIDPWVLPEVTIEYTPWSELSTKEKLRRVLWDYFGKSLLLLCCLYFFVCALDLLSDAFRLIGGKFGDCLALLSLIIYAFFPAPSKLEGAGNRALTPEGKTAGSVFKNNSLLGNPLTGLMIGVLTTVLLQSSSTTNGIAISLVVSKVLEVKDVIPIVMGANIGTSVTSTIVSMGQITSKNDFRRAFAAATVHDMFNWVSVIVLLPLEITTGYLYRLTKTIVSSINFPQDTEQRNRLQFLKTLTKPFTRLIIKVDTALLKEIATGNEQAMDKSIIKHCCKKQTVIAENLDTSMNGNLTYNSTEEICLKKCEFMFESVPWSDTTVGIVLLVLSLILLTACFITIVKTLYSVLRGHILAVIKTFINANFPGCFRHFTGYVAILIGTGITMIVQSSSVFTSALTPLVGIGILSLERMYPLTLGANLGTTFTAVIIALSQSADDMPVAFHVALCHMFFNITGIIIFYPLPFMRIPIKMAKFLGNQTAKYRWFGIMYMIVMFVIVPLIVFGVSIISWIALTAILVTLLTLLLAVTAINILQAKQPNILPKRLRSWTFLPIYLRSLQPYDYVIRKLIEFCMCCSTKTGKANSDIKT